MMNARRSDNERECEGQIPIHSQWKAKARGGVRPSDVSSGPVKQVAQQAYS